MRNKLKRFLMNPWTIGIGTAIVLPSFVAAFKSLFQNINIWQSISTVFNDIVIFLSNILGFGIPVYIILICIILLIIIKKVMGKVSENAKPAFLKYKQDDIRSWRMKWEYYKGPYDQKYSIQNLRPVCQCDCELSNNYSQLTCPNCGKIYPILAMSDIDDVRKIISYNVSKGQFNQNNT